MHQINSDSEPALLELAVVPRKGRKRKLTQPLFEKIMRSIEAGERIDPACRRHGISERTVFKLIQDDAAAARRFEQAKRVRLAHWHEEWLGEMCEHSKRSPWATGFLLERNFPALYAMKQVPREPAPATDNGHLEKMILTMTPEDYAELSQDNEYKMCSDGALERLKDGVRLLVYPMSENDNLLK
jgi:hypothetical protein